MVFKVLLFACAVACARAGIIASPYAAPYAAAAYAAPAYASPYASPYAHSVNNYPALTSQSQNTLRSFGNLGQVSTFSKTIDTPFSSVSKSDVRVSNPGYAVAAPAAYHGYAAPAYAATYAAPAYAAPAYHGYAGYGAPIAKVAAAPLVAGHAGLLGVAYSAAPTVSHMTYSNGLGLAYNW